MLPAWKEVLDGHPVGCQLADRHYSRKTKGAPLFVGPGKKLVLITPNYKALFVWRKCEYRLDNQKGVECTIFRNESDILSSELIKEACLWAWQKWPGARLFTYVNTEKVKSSNPGYCFLMAGWKKCGTNKTGQLLLFENLDYENKIPANMQLKLV